MAVIWNFFAMSGSQQRRCQITKFPDPPPPPSTASPHLNCTSHNSVKWPGISSRTITVITDLCQAPRPLSSVSWGSGRIFTISTFRLNFVLYFFVSEGLFWTAPELLQVRNHKNVQCKKTQRGDVYSYGIILHEILTRDEPYYQLEPKGTVCCKNYLVILVTGIGLSGVQLSLCNHTREKIGFPRNILQ